MAFQRFPFLITATLFVVVATFNGGNTKDDVKRRFHVSEATFRSVKRIHTPQSGNFSFNDCGAPSKELIVLLNLGVSPDPLSFPGNMTINLTTVFNTTIDKELQVQTVMYKKVNSTLEYLNCTNNFGSCYYDDFCKTLAPIKSCPPAFKAIGMPCKCPFTKGSYTFHNSTIDVPYSIPSGLYKIDLILGYKGRFVSCWEFQVAFE